MMNKWLFTTGFLMIVINGYANNTGTFVQNHIGNHKIQGLKYVNNTVQDFIKNHNKLYGTKWRALEPNAKTLVAKCQVPLTAKWAIVPNQIHYVIRVGCLKTGAGSHNKRWHIDIKTDRPIAKIHH